jgi:hypothetical protein
MTLKELADAINAMPPEEQKQVAEVWPPAGCPAAVGVAVTGIGEKPTRTKVIAPVILTGKDPA